MGEFTYASFVENVNLRNLCRMKFCVQYLCKILSAKFAQFRENSESCRSHLVCLHSQNDILSKVFQNFKKLDFKFSKLDSFYL